MEGLIEVASPNGFATFSLVGSLDDGNFGDDWQLIIFCTEIIARYPNCKIRIRAESSFAKSLEKKFAPQVRAIPRRFFFYRSPQIMVGGEIFFFHPPRESLLRAKLRKLDGRFFGTLLKCYSILRYAAANTNLFAKSTYGFGIGFGDFSAAPTYRKKRLGFELRNIVFAVFRDSVSRDNYQAMRYLRSIQSKVASDLSFLDILDRGVHPSITTICLVIRRSAYASKENLLVLISDFQRLTNQLCLDFKILLCERDSELEEFLRKHQIGNFVTYDGLNLEDFMNEIKLSTHIFSMRLHTILYGASMGRRVYSIGLDEKFSKSVGDNLVNLKFSEFSSISSEEFSKILDTPLVYSAFDVQSRHSSLSLEFDRFLRVLVNSEDVGQDGF